MVLDFVSDNPIAITQVLLSIVLAAATVAYAIYAGKQVKESRKNRRDNIKPVIKGGVNPLGGKVFTFVLHNTGQGAAHNLTTKMFFKDATFDHSIDFKTPTFQAGAEQEFKFPLPEERPTLNADKIKQKLEDSDSNGRLVIESSFVDISGEKHEQRDEIDLIDVLNNQTGIDTSGEMKKLRKTVEKIESHLNAR